MKTNDPKKALLEALKGRREGYQNRRAQSQIDKHKLDLERSKNLAKGSLDKDVLKATGSAEMADVTEARTKLPKGTDRIDTRQIAELSDKDEYAKRMKDLDMKQMLKSTFKAAADSGDDEMMGKLRQIASKMGKGLKTGVKGLPVLGALAAGFGSEDASAAIPGLGAAESLGPQKGSLEGDIEAGEMDEERMKEMARRMALQNKLMGGE